MSSAERKQSQQGITPVQTPKRTRHIPGTALRWKKAFAIAIICLFVPMTLFIPAQPAYAQENVWRLTAVLVNPDNEKLEYYGGGSDPAYYAEERYDGKFIKYSVSENSFLIEDRWVDYGEQWYHITFSFTFEALPEVLIPGESYALKMDFSPGGSLSKGNPGAVFRYGSPSLSIGTDIPLPDNTFRDYPWSQAPGGLSSVSWVLIPPAAGEGATFEVYAYGGTPACMVKWIYQASNAVPDTATAAPEARKDEAAQRVFTDEEFEAMKADAANYGSSYWGSDYQKDLLREGFIGLIVHTVGDTSVYDYSGRPMRAGTPRVAEYTAAVQPIRVGDTLKTGEGSAMVVIFPRYKTDSHVIHVGHQSEVIFTRPGTTAQDHTISQTLVQMVKGWVRAYIQNWSGGIFDVRVGTTLIGIRGSDVLIFYDPVTDVVLASVNEGHMDVTSMPTDQTVSLTDGQYVFAWAGAFEQVMPMAQQDWDDMVSRHGVEHTRSYSAEEIEQLLQPSSIEPLSPAEPVKTGGRVGWLALIIILVVIAAAVAGAGVFLLIKLLRRSPGGKPPPNRPPAASPRFCSRCGSDIKPGSVFCKKCGRRL